MPKFQKLNFRNQIRPQIFLANLLLTIIAIIKREVPDIKEITKPSSHRM